MYVYVALTDTASELNTSRRVYRSYVPAFDIAHTSVSQRDVIRLAELDIEKLVKQGIKPKLISHKQICQNRLFGECYVVDTKDFSTSKILKCGDKFDEYLISVVDKSIRLEKYRQLMMLQLKKRNKERRRLLDGIDK